MELALGGEIFALIEEMDVIPEPAVKYYAGAVALALGHLHSLGFIYRDLKPENLLLDVRGYLKVCDLGLAKRTEHALTVVGTPQYLAPEVLRGEGATKAADWWALGVLVFEMLNGELPFNTMDGTDRSLFTAIKLGAYTWPKEPRRSYGHSANKAQAGTPALPSARVRDFVSCLLRQPIPPHAGSTRGNGGSSTRSAKDDRLGASAGDVDDVRSHIWFHSFDFDGLLSGAMPPPFVPKLTGSDDDANFGPIDWRGEPIVHDPGYDHSKWDSMWLDW